MIIFSALDISCLMYGYWDRPSEKERSTKSATSSWQGRYTPQLSTRLSITYIPITIKINLLEHTTLSLIAVTATGAASLRQSFERDGAVMRLYATCRRSVSTGELEPDPQDKLLVVNDGDPATEATTIMTFNFPSSVQDRTCKLLFDLWDGDVSTGSQTVNVFSTIDPPGSPEVSASSRGHALAVMQSRGQQTGRVHVAAPGEADWVMSFYGMPEFPCPAGQLTGLEFVGVGDAVTMRWGIGVTGPRVQVL